MELVDALRNRRSVRSYQARPVEREKLEELAEALRISPSASNQQPWRLVLVDDPELKAEAAAAHLALRAADLGLGACLLGWFDERKVKKLLGIPRSRRIGLLATVGYPVEGVAQGSSRRKPLDEVGSYNRY